MNGRILVVDDEKEIADLVELYLKNEGFMVFKFNRGQEALDFANENEIDCAVLDVMLPDIDGFSICQTIREKSPIPILMLTAKVEDMDKIMGLTIGADDYMTKPFNPLELAARIKAQVRRHMRYNALKEVVDDEVSELEFSGLLINRDTHKCELYGKTLPLTPIEFSILWYLGIHRGRVVSSEELFEAVWKEKYLDSNNTVMAHIGRLREKMHEPPRNPKILKTVWGVGYQIE